MGAITDARLSLAQAVTDAILVVDASLAVRYANPAAAALFGLAPAQLTGSSLFGLMHPDDAGGISDLVVAGARGEKAAVLDARVVRADGSESPFQLRATRLNGVPGVEGVVLTAYESAAQRGAEAHVAADVERDSLTGLLGRTSFKLLLGRDLEGNAANRRVTVLFIDRLRAVLRDPGLLTLAMLAPLAVLLIASAVFAWRIDDPAAPPRPRDRV